MRSHYQELQREDEQGIADELYTRNTAKRARTAECDADASLADARLSDISKAINALIIKPLILTCPKEGEL